ncbi:hypothetical protein EFR84_27470 [Rhizobium chutanense]|uniref:Uncharacterized protein n=1 Tax=Rhizobium chutanense TaxID=2035448 RepID=A0A3S0RMB8_9HYPH|nr:hypothetical protein EFR84_27470 [Rhizobium chutanense]
MREAEVLARSKEISTTQGRREAREKRCAIRCTGGDFGKNATPHSVFLGLDPRKTECGGAYTASTASAAVLLEFLQTSRLLPVFVLHLRHARA